MSRVLKFPAYIINNKNYKKITETFHPVDLHLVHEILNRVELDFYPKHGFFSYSDHQKICEIAVGKFLEKMTDLDPENLSSEEIRYEWKEIINSFIDGYWGFLKMNSGLSGYQPQSYGYVLTASLPKKSAKGVSYKDTFFYIWSVIQSFILMKALILVYGNELAKDDSMENRILFGLVMLFAFGSLFVFVWLRRKKKYT